MKCLLSLFLVVCSLTVNAQSVIKGTVRSTKNKPVIHANITLGETYDGATTDSTGSFLFSTFETGHLTIFVQAEKFKTTTHTVQLPDSTIFLQFVLKPGSEELETVVITAGSFEASDKKRGAVLNAIDMATTAGANADITGALKTLPGTQQVGETEGLFVRGGAASEANVYIDGNLVNNFFYSSVPGVAQRGRFSPFLFKGTVFSSGGYSALYGQALSAALILETIDLPEKSEGLLNLSLIGADIGYQHLSKNKKSSWGFMYGYSHLGLAFRLIKLQQDFYKTPSYHTADFNFRHKTSTSGIFKYYGYISSNKLGMRAVGMEHQNTNDVFELTNLNMLHNLSYRESLGKGWRMYLSYAYSYNRDNIDGDVVDSTTKQPLTDEHLNFKRFNLNNPSHYHNGRAYIEKRFWGLSQLRMGGEYNYTKVSQQYQSKHLTEVWAYDVLQNNIAAYAEADVYISRLFAAKVGGRWEYAELLRKSNLAPRVSASYKTGKNSQASLAYGHFYQNPENRYLPSPHYLNFAKAIHYIAQFQHSTPRITFRTELFYKDYKQLTKTAFNPFYQQMAVNSNGNGYAKGFELFWRDRKSIKNLDYWVSYSYLDTERDFLNYPYAIQPNFAARHTSSLVLKRFVPEIKTGFNLSYTYSTGRPYFHIAELNGNHHFTDRGKTPDYHNLSFSLNYLPSLFSKDSKLFPILVVSVSNLLGLQPTFGYNYSLDGSIKTPIYPPYKRFVFVGAFISFGTDRREEKINSHL